MTARRSERHRRPTASGLMPVAQAPSHFGRGARSAPRGLTLIELTIALGVAATLFAAVIVGIGSVTGQKARESAGELAGVMRSLYDTASLSGKTCRLVFDLPGARDEETPVKYRAECAASAVTAASDREAAQREATEQEEDARSGRTQTLSRRGGFGDSYQDLVAQEENRVEKSASFSGYTSPEIESRNLPPEVRVSVWTRQQREYSDTGQAFLYFFPQGFTEKAQVVLRQGENAWTLIIEPLTGKVRIVGEAKEVPKL